MTTSTNTVVSDQIQNICYEFINDPDTIIGIECNWPEYLIKKVSFEYNTDKENIVEKISVINHKYANDNNVYITFRNKMLIISTKKRYLYE